MATNPLSGVRTYDPMTANAPKDATSTGTSAADQTQKFLTLLIAQIKNLLFCHLTKSAQHHHLLPWKPRLRVTQRIQLDLRYHP
jgi:hypothetical protein